MFASLFIISCGGGGDSNDIITPPAPTVDPPSMATLNSPEITRYVKRASVNDVKVVLTFNGLQRNNTIVMIL